MVKTILLVLCIVFAVLGLCEIIYFTKMFFYYPGVRSKNLIFVVLNNKYALKQLNFLWQKIKWQGDDYANAIIAITDNIDEFEMQNCKKFVFGKNIALCELKTLTECHYLQGDFLNGNR